MEKKKSKFMIEPSEAEALMREKRVSKILDLLPLLVPEAQRLARPPISNFPVGAVGLGSSGRIYIGCNIEFPGVPLHHSIHAEQFLLANASLHSEPQILSIAVSAAPCGHCRQFLQELRSSQILSILVTSDPDPTFLPLTDFLPRPFGPLDLLSSDRPLLLETQHTPLNAHTDPHECGDMEGLLVEAAAEAARKAYAPYSGCASGFAVADGEGRVFSGSYMESAAYNPSLPPVQAALVGYIVGGGGDWEGITGGALVEGEGGMVSHEATARVFFETVAPNARVWIRRFRLGGGGGDKDNNNNGDA